MFTYSFVIGTISIQDDFTYMRIFPLAQSVHFRFEHNESPYKRK